MAMKPVNFSREETRAMVAEIQEYFSDEMDQTIGAMPAEMLMRFFADRIGGYFYNRGLYDAQTAIAARVETLTDDLLALEQPTRHLR